MHCMHITHMAMSVGMSFHGLLAGWVRCWQQWTRRTLTAYSLLSERLLALYAVP